MCTTNDEELATRLRMIRNHAESVVGPANISNLTNMIGFNYRMTELSAAIGIAQLSSIEKHVGDRKKFAEKISRIVDPMIGLKPPIVREKCSHVYYLWALKVSSKELGVSRSTLAKAMISEGFLVLKDTLSLSICFPFSNKKKHLVNSITLLI